MAIDKDLSLRVPQKRLQLAFRAIYFVVSLSKKLKKTTRLLSRVTSSASHVPIEIQPLDDDHHEDGAQHVPILDVDLNALSDVVRERDFDVLCQFGGFKDLAVTRETYERLGIPGDKEDIKHRVDVIGPNAYSRPPARTFLSFVIEGLKETTILVRLACAVLSLGFGIKQHGPREWWYDGGSAIAEIFLVIAVSAASNFKQSTHFEKLSEESSDIQVEVASRDGRRPALSTFEVVVGDSGGLKIGDQVPADGLSFDGHSLKVSESIVTGESDHVEVNEAENPFLLSGAKVTDG